MADQQKKTCSIEEANEQEVIIEPEALSRGMGRKPAVQKPEVIRVDEESEPLSEAEEYISDLDGRDVEDIELSESDLSETSLLRK